MTTRRGRNVRLTAGVLTSLLLQLVASPVAYAKLERVGPTDPVHGYPQWVQDSSGLTLEFCSPTNVAEEEGWCLLIPGDIPNGAPETFPTNFADEHFYWAGGASTNAGALVLGLEAAFGLGPVQAGEQVLFGRIRFRVTVPAGNVRIYTPFKVFTFDGHEGGEINFTEDFGLQCLPGDFSCALAGPTGPFLVPAMAPGAAEVGPVTSNAPGAGDPVVIDPLEFAPYPNTGRKYLANPGRVGPVTGSTLPAFEAAAPGPLDGLADPANPLLRNPNIFRIEVQTPAGWDTVDETYDFDVMGRIYEGTLPGRVVVERANYAQPVVDSPSGKKVDVFATALPTVVSRVPPAAVVPPQPPNLQFYEAACAVDPVTGALKRPVVLDPVTGLPVLDAISNPILLPAIPMFAIPGWKYMAGQSEPTTIPANVCVEQTNALDANNNGVSIFTQAPVTDQIFITEAVFNPNDNTLSVKASSSDQLKPPLLSVGGYGDFCLSAPCPATNQVPGQLLAPALAPPNKITVVSTSGGLNKRQVASLYRTAAVVNAPVATDDTMALVEDTPAILDVLINDTLAGAEIPAGALVSVVQAPLLGQATVNPDGTIRYTPAPNANGTDGFFYLVDVNGFISNTGHVVVNIAPVNDAPVAANDAFVVPLNVPTALNVFANDSDPDGNLDLASAVNVTQVSGPTLATLSAAGGVVTFTAPLGGTYTFTYQAQDAGGGVVPPAPLLSNVATVTVTIAAAEVINVAKAEFIDRQLRWTVSGTVTPSVNQTVTIAYGDGQNQGFVIGTATANAAGNWVLDFRPATGLANPNNTNATRLLITGPGGGASLPTFRIK